MTTAWAHLVRGELIEAARANLGGVVLAVMAIAAVPWLLGSAARGRWLVAAPSGAAVAWVSAIVVLVTLIDWVIRLVAG
jgi:hypothetical protein